MAAFPLQKSLGRQGGDIGVDVAVVAPQGGRQVANAPDLVAAHIPQKLRSLAGEHPRQGVPALERQMALGKAPFLLSCRMSAPRRI